MELVRFEGNCPSNVSKDAKYSVKYDAGEYVIGIVYRSTEGEKWYPISGDHPELVEMVNNVKVSAAGSPGGAFYINEYKQVIVPAIGERDYFLAGESPEPLKFEFEGNILSGDGIDMGGNPLSPGDNWVGPHPGISYILEAGGRDIRYESEPRPRVKKEIHLSDYHDNKTVASVCEPIAAVKGHQGGPFYINEYCQLFAPVTTDYDNDYRYIGRLKSLDDWFPKPHS